MLKLIEDRGEDQVEAIQAVIVQLEALKEEEEPSVLMLKKNVCLINAWMLKTDLL